MKVNTMRIQEELLRCSITQRELADAAGVTEVTISRYIHGTRIPRKYILLKIAQKLGVTPEYLTSAEELESPNSDFSRIRKCVITHADNWTKEQKISLINEIMKTI